MTISTRVSAYRLLLALSLTAVQGCTDLTEVPKSAVTPENFYRNEAEVLAGLAAVYALLGGDNDGILWSYYNVSEVTTDEMIVPTRGPDWFDNGRWLELHRHQWGPGSPSGLDDIQNVWLVPYRGVAYANVVLDALDRVDIPNETTVRAELRGLRALYYYMLNDMFGGVPVATDIVIQPRARATRDSLFRFIETELLAVRADLPLTRPPDQHGRLTRGAADAILANMYLNAGVFAKETGVSATAYNSCSGVTVAGGLDACQAAENFADSILNSGVYAMAANWRSNFTADNHNSAENILVGKNHAANDLGLNFPQRTLHYEQFSTTPWNGFSAVAEAYRSFDANDQRRQMFLIGPQVHVETGDSVCERPGCASGGVRLVFTDTIGNATNARENEGPRFYKYPHDPSHVSQNNGNDFVFFRLAEIYMIKAEANFKRTASPATALGIINTQIRARVFTPAQPLATVNDSTLLAERLFEFAGEAKRRQDLIRFGRYTSWTEATVAGKNAASAPHRILMPIPQTQLDANPLLVQNPGY